MLNVSEVINKLLSERISFLIDDNFMFDLFTFTLASCGLVCIKSIFMCGFVTFLNNNINFLNLSKLLETSKPKQQKQARIKYHKFKLDLTKYEWK